MTGCKNLCSSANFSDKEVKSPQQATISSKPASPSSSGDLPINPYHALQVRRDATSSEIRQAYRRMALWHHPGRSTESLGERQRRLQVFEILAACYETLRNAEYRRRLDIDLREMEVDKLQAGVKGEMFVGGKRIKATGDASPGRSLLCRSTLGSTDSHEDQIPSLSRASTESSTEHDDEENNELADDIQFLACSPTSSVADLKTRSLVDVSTSGSGSAEEAENHYSESETKRLFGGPLSRLYRARNFEPFTDPFELFKQVFGSQIFPISREEIGQLKEWAPLRSTRPAGWEGSAATSPDGKWSVYTTSRVWHDRRMTRTETVTADPRTGRIQKCVTVTAEELELEPDDEQVSSNCISCFHPTEDSQLKDGEEPFCFDIYDMYDQIANELELGGHDIYSNWINVFNVNGYTSDRST